ncbi:hypothetical protein BHY_1027 (plasmid) [Borrelia nietonii YOR]|uniref:Uncharacterized protein n=2 Tax=Borrelia TaxID=138 RepID=W5SBA0_9SPIR|nr:hypothetical protein BHY_1027 [Borrelia nietonii YOR]AHH14546.1 hypothetical protein BHW_0900023 [Borrelia hermsii MTW]
MQKRFLKDFIQFLLNFIEIMDKFNCWYIIFSINMYYLSYGINYHMINKPQ